MPSLAQYTSYSLQARFHTPSRSFLPVRLLPASHARLFDPHPSPQPTLTGSSSPTMTLSSLPRLPSPMWGAETSAASFPSSTVSHSSLPSPPYSSHPPFPPSPLPLCTHRQHPRRRSDTTDAPPTRLLLVLPIIPLTRYHRQIPLEQPNEHAFEREPAHRGDYCG